MILITTLLQTDNILSKIVENRKPILGNEKASLKIVIFDDPDCPFCRKAIPFFKQLYENNQNKVAIYVRYFPLDIHPDAKRKSIILACSKDYFKTKELLIQGKDVKSDIKDCNGEKIVQEDLEYGYNLGIRGTPTFIIFTEKDTVGISGAPPDYETIRKTLSERFKIELK
ncbi:MAG: thioredoxin fold domain-containing protein [candidate division WOR-3 bacterium]|nr:thioredoxin fold domain-containing protein [candidate division WOR-3 bacterium]